MKNPINRIATVKPPISPTGVGRLLMLTFVLLFASQLSAANVLGVGTVSVNKASTATLPISLTNTESVSALQFELNFPAGFVYESISLSSRKVDHTVSATVVQTGKLRVVIYSSTQKALTGTSGAVVSINLKSDADPVTKSLSISNIVLSSAAGVSVAAANPTAGSITVNGQKAEISALSLIYGRVANGTAGNAAVTIYNRGNQPFTIQSATTTNAHFTLSNSSPITVAGNSSANLTVNFNNSAGDFDYKAILNITTSDPEPTRSSFAVSLTATAYSRNTLQVGSVSGKTGTELLIPLRVKNETDLTGAQFEIILPDSARFVENSLTKGNVLPAGYQLSAQQTDNRLRIICYTNGSAVIPSSDAEFCSFKVKMNNYPGTYSLTASQPILANTTGLNVLTSNTAGTIQLTAPKLSVSSSINFGLLNVGPTVFEKTFTVSNTGNEPLIISAFNFDNAAFSLKNASLPITLNTGQSQTLTMRLTNVTTGAKTGTMSVLSNEKISEIKVGLSANVFANFELAAVNQTAMSGANSQFDFSIKNDLAIALIQFDLESPFAISNPMVNKSTRISNWSASCYSLSNGKYRVFAYSVNNSSITGTDGVVLSMPVNIPSGLTLGQYNLTLSNVIVSNAAGQNVVTKSTNAVLTVNGVYTELADVKSDIVIKKLENEISVQSSNKCIISLFDLQGHLLHQQHSTGEQTLIPFSNTKICIVKVVTGGEVYVRSIMGYK